MTFCNLLALTVYCIWKLRSHGAAAEVDADAPLELPVLREETGCSNPVQQTTFHIEELPRKFSYDEIRAVTGDFGTMLGRGGSGEVFRGLLDDGTLVAVKRITSDKPVGEAVFLREVSIVASVHHRSLVRLLGYCLLRGGGSQYLILHLDVKPANILLAGGLRAHVSDFGISMSIAQDMTSVDNRGRGTPGYMTPLISLCRMSVKFDVYSYGMTVLELVSGRRSFASGEDLSSETPNYFARVVREKMARGALMEVVDAAMARADEGEVEAVVKVALCCVQHRQELRPSMHSRRSCRGRSAAGVRHGVAESDPTHPKIV
ncbi:probable receptor-like protein kinase At5g20050 [Setaria viridis]|uniref:probable receptor-like protein kinase At5g20050 n=1 Tax=Setaria viridis TaxID=4556 RepID=UPI001493AC54|nr:probable receptor-like protein kinase At5g20050 [Setaria viridis]